MTRAALRWAGLALMLAACPAAFADDDPVQDVDKDCPPCAEARRGFESSKDNLDDALVEQQRALDELERIKYKGSDEHAAALRRAEAAGEKVKGLERAMGEASAGLREELAEHQKNAQQKYEDYKKNHPPPEIGIDPMETPEAKKLREAAEAADEARKFHDDPTRDKDRDNLRNVQRENQERLDEERRRRQEADQVVGAKPPAGGQFNPPKEPAKAKEYLDKVIQEDPNSAAALGARASANFKLGNNAAACADAKAALASNPNHEEAFGIKQLACNAGRVAEPKPTKLASAKPMEAAPQGATPPAAAPRPPPPALTAPAASGGAGSGEPWMGAVALTREVGTDNAAESAIHSKAAAANLMSRNYKAAAAEADRALALNPRNAHARLMRATARNGMKNYRGALEDAEEGLKLAPKNLPLLNTKAQAQIKLKDYKGALATANEILEIDPTNAAALAQKAYALGGLGDRESMLDALRRAAAMDPRFQSSLDSAMNPPANADALFYFPGEDASEKAPASKKGGFPVKIVLAGLFAGGLILLIILKPSAPAPEAAVPQASGPVSTAPGSLLKDQYEFVKEIGQGGMGAVHEAFDKKLDRKVAVKRMRDELKSDPRELAHFVQEAKIVSHLSHPYIVGIHDIVEEGGDLFLVLDFVDGQPLSAILGERKRFTFKEAKDIMSYVCQAVEFAHKNKVTHRDLKPSNIMVDKNWFVKVMDFGLAREAKETLSRLTRGDASGTPAYMAPEHHLGGAEPASDIFSLGVCLYEMVTGQLPYRGADLLAAKERRQYTPPRLVVSTLPAGFDELMASLLSPEPGKRPAGAGKLLEELNKLA